MRITYLLLFLFFISDAIKAQQALVIKDSLTLQPLKGVSITAANNNLLTNDSGKALLHYQGLLQLSLSYINYTTKNITVYAADTNTLIILLAQQENALQNVTVVSSTRSNEPIENATTKVEVLGIEEMNEESTLKPGNIASILGDMSGIQIQQSSATTGNSNVRIQGLDGKYTQILRDGMPLYEGYSGGFGILTIPPLDLQQIELIKGSASTLYGGGAIGGLINLISKKPAYQPDASLLINQTTLKETNINAYYAQRWKHAGFTLFAGENLQKQVDVNDDGFSDVPNTKSTLIHPTLFIYPSDKTYISLSWSGSFEKRIGGDMIAINDPLKDTISHPYFEKNKLDRNTFSVISESKFSHKITATVKATYSLFNRNETTNTYTFNGKQNSYYAEASLMAKAGTHNLTGGINITGDDFKPSTATPAPVGYFSNTSFGAFVQDNAKLFSKTKLEAGLRYDHHTKYGDFILPRVALFQPFGKGFGTRLGFGLGYKTPNPLTPQIEDYTIYQIQPLSNDVKAEKSIGANAEINYKKVFGNGNKFFINHAFFLTSINDPLVATINTEDKVSFINAGKTVGTKGFDTYMQVELHAWELYLGYTYTDAERNYLSTNKFVWLTPRNRAAAVVAYEIEGKWRFGLEGSYTGFQYRVDNSKTPGFMFLAAMMEKKFGPVWSLVLNCENVLDERQSRYESLYTGSITNPSFKPLWAPIDGRVVNLSLRYKPFEK